VVFLKTQIHFYHIWNALGMKMRESDKSVQMEQLPHRLLPQIKADKNRSEMDADKDLFIMSGIGITQRCRTYPLPRSGIRINLICCSIPYQVDSVIICVHPFFTSAIICDEKGFCFWLGNENT
jgi:hypothetical protein